MLTRTLVAVAITSLSTVAWSAVSPDEAKQLGTTLTAIGAERAGNKDGTIPEYTGGIKEPPAAFHKGSIKRVDPYANEKPRLVIDGKSAAQHTDKLTEGTKELLKRYATMRVDVYPTHRPVVVPQRIIENTQRNAIGTKLTEGGLGTENMLPGYPFPMPRSGHEVMWNHLLKYQGIGWQGKYDSWNVDSSGTPILATTGDVTYAWPMYDPKKAGAVKESDPFWYVKLNYLAPARRNGEAMLIWDSANPLKQARRAWQYLPGQRRVKLAPDIGYDTPNPGSAGTSTYSDAGVFNGAMDRFDWKLVGKKEMYIPYGNYKLTYDAKPADITKPNHINPDLVRWELHRVWVVEATLKADKRDIYGKRVFYVDEDSWTAIASDEYDGRGQLYRAAFNFPSFSYDQQAQFNDTQAFYDFTTGMYNVTGLFGAYTGLKYLTEMPSESFWAPDALAGAGLR